MKIASFLHDGAASYGLVVDDGVVDVGRRIGKEFPTLRALLASADFETMLRGYQDKQADHRMNAVRWLGPVPHPMSIISCGANFKGHIAEMMEVGMLKQPPKQPSFHIKTPSSFSPHLEPIVLPKASADLDYEAEFSMVIGIGGRHISRADAMKHVLGYTCINDGSVRDYQQKQSIGAGKNFDKSGGYGPWIVTKDEAGDVTDRSMITRVNGEVLQNEKLSELTFGLAEMIEYISGVIYLHPGDVITTGTTAGVGIFRKPERWLKAGETIEIEIEGLCVLKNDIVAEK